MGYDETKIIKYVIFGKREELEQFPSSKQALIFEDDTEQMQVRPLYLFWDKADEKWLQLITGLEKKSRADSMPLRIINYGLFSTMSGLLIRHVQNKYNEVFLSNPETLFLSEKAETEIPEIFWNKKPGRREELHLKFGETVTLKILEEHHKSIALFLLLPKECRFEEFRLWLMEAEKRAGIHISDLFLFGTLEQKENGEDILDVFYEETGLAGSFYPTQECKKILASMNRSTLLFDGRGLALQDIGRPTFYIDGAGVRTGREIHKLEGVCTACRSLRNQLDRAFLSAL